ncbi:trimethylamine methyltransferase family protein [Rhodospirillaceae bacterium KN72]|uniref:Methyltransferase n=1 Tax=Pacificispira spongiicola TaxID=2729598 RepID=A0A7Y0DZ26_9PROT|nr:trimethylamine methyltransferase family protein [Pacificispira spongiicola]NMM44217.1 trimethylamine methyltransferase family protein [Pacificispira spongiicola]
MTLITPDEIQGAAPSSASPTPALADTGGSRRRGGRLARQALRAAPLTDDIRPVRPGMEGGHYQVLNETDILRIHTAALEILETVGLADAIPTCIEAVTARGGFLNEYGRLCIPRALVEDTLAIAARKFVLHGQDPRHDMEPWGKKVYFGTAGAAVHIVDPVTRKYRESTTRDLYDIARLVDAMDHIHFFQRSVVCRDLPDPFEMDFNTCYASVRGTSKHVGSSWVHPDHFDASLEMLHMIAGGEDKWRARPFVSMSNCFVVPPMKFAEDACRCLESAVKGGMPILLLAAGQAGATSPASLAGAVVQEVAEVLAGLVYVNALKPGHPCIFGTWPFVSDLRTGAMSGGSGEQALLMAACAQMANFYDLTGGVCAGMADSKIPDAQAGYEKGYNYALVGNSGANLVYESAGMHASLLGFCLESVLMDNDAIGASLRTVRGIETDDDSLSVETIRQVCIEGPGHYLGHSQTIGRMQKDYVYPLVGDRTSPKEWVEGGSTTIIDRAVKKTAELLRTHHPSHISDAVDAEIRAKFPVGLNLQ